MEEWIIIESAPNYAVSSAGRIRRLTDAPGTYAGKILAQSSASNGYLQVNLSANGIVRTRKVHTLVAEAFHGERPGPLHQVAHQNGNKTDNRKENLRWATPTENSADDIKNNTRPLGVRHPLARLTEADVLAIRSARGRSFKQLAEQYGMTVSGIKGVVYGTNWKHVHAQAPADSAA